MLGLGWFRMKKQNSAFSEFCNVGARPVYALSARPVYALETCLGISLVEHALEDSAPAFDDMV